METARGCGNASTCNDRSAERHGGVNHHRARLVEGAPAREGEETNRQPFGVTLNTLKIGVKHSAHSQLPVARNIDQLPIPLNEQMDPVRHKVLLRERVPGVWLLLR